MADRPRTKEEQALEALLKAWGREYGEDYRDEPRRWIHRTAAHPIAQSMQFAPGKTVRQATRQLVGRGGYQRRKIMGAAAGRLTAKGTVLPVPMGFVDPIPSKAKGTARFGSTTRPVPPALQKVEQAVLTMESFNLIRALCVRVQYASDGKQEDKFAKVNEKLRQISKGHPGIGLARFRDELTFARFFLHGVLLQELHAA